MDDRGRLSDFRLMAAASVPGRVRRADASLHRRFRAHAGPRQRIRSETGIQERLDQLACGVDSPVLWRVRTKFGGGFDVSHPGTRPEISQSARGVFAAAADSTAPKRG